VSLADKLDTVASFFGAAMPPTGSKDPFALRRSALGALSIIVDNKLRFSLQQVLANAQRWLLYYGHGLAGSETNLLEFFADRLKVQQREAGVRHDLIDAVFALGGEDDLVRLLARVRALQAFVETPEGADLLAGYKRAANILRKEGWEGSGTDQKQLSYTPEDEEQRMIAALDSAEPKARAAVAAEDFEGAMAALASLRAPVDAFFDKVTVNDSDPAKRAARLALLARMRDAVHTVADFSRIEG
jgi:glycyl-tRNA synthetase beta chain